MITFNKFYFKKIFLFGIIIILVITIVFSFREFQPIASTFNDNSLLSGQDTRDWTPDLLFNH